MFALPEGMEGSGDDNDDDDEDISADVAESAVLAMEPDVPDTRKMLIRVRRKQSMETVAGRYGVSVGQLKAWNKTRRDLVTPGQVLVLHVPVGKAKPSEPGPAQIATNVSRGSVQRIGSRVADTGPKSRYDKKHGRVRAEIVKVSDPVKAKSSSAAPVKALKGTASRQKAVAHTQKQKSK